MTLGLILDDLILQPRLGDSQPPDNGPQMAAMLAAALNQIKTMEAQLSSASGTPASAGSLRRSTQIDAATLASAESVPSQAGDQKIICNKNPSNFFTYISKHNSIDT